MSKILKITAEENISDLFFNVKPASEFIPDWYRLSPGTIPGAFSNLIINSRSATTSTYKKCTPFLDALTVGYIAYLTSDIEVIKKPNGDPFVMHRQNTSVISDHSTEQWMGLIPPNGYHTVVFKWNSQVSFNTPTGYSLLFTNPINRFDLPFQTVNGFVDTDKYNLPIHFPFFIHESFTGIIEKGTPIAQIIPIKRDVWKKEHEQYDAEKTKKKYDSFFSTIKRSYKTNYWTRKEYK